MYLFFCYFPTRTHNGLRQQALPPPVVVAAGTRTSKQKRNLGKILGVFATAVRTTERRPTQATDLLRTPTHKQRGRQTNMGERHKTHHKDSRPLSLTNTNKKHRKCTHGQGALSHGSAGRVATITKTTRRGVQRRRPRHRLTPTTERRGLVVCASSISGITSRTHALPFSGKAPHRLLLLLCSLRCTEKGN